MSALPCTSTQRAFQDGLETYVRAARKNSTGAPTFKIPLDARARKRSFGFSFGKFALDYTSQDLELDPEKISVQERNQDTRTLDRAPDPEVFFRPLDSGQSPKQSTDSEPSALDMRLGSAAYAESALLPAYTRPGTLIGVA